MPEDTLPDSTLTLHARARAENLVFLTWAFESTAIAEGDPFLLAIDDARIEVWTDIPNRELIGQLPWSEDPNDLSIYASAGTPKDPWPQLYIYYENGVGDDETYEYGTTYIDIVVTPVGETSRLATLGELEHFVNDIRELRAPPSEPSNTTEP